MKKIIYLFIICVMGICIVAGCGKKNSEEESAPLPPSGDINVLNAREYVLSEYETQKISVAEGIDLSEATFYSEDPNVADIDGEGNIYAYNAGATNIVAKKGGAQNTCRVSVVRSEFAADFTAADEFVKLKKGTGIKIDTSLRIGYRQIEDYEISVTSSDESKVSCMALGKAVSVYGAESTSVNAQITVVCSYFKHNFYCNIDVAVVPDVSFSLSDSSVVLASYNAGGKLSGHITQTQLSTYLFENGTETENAEISWRSENDHIASVEGGLVSAHSLGETDIIASYFSGGQVFEAYCRVNVYTPTIALSVSPVLYLNASDGSNVLDLSAVSEFDIDGNGVFVKDITDGEMDIDFSSNEKKYTVDRNDLRFGSRLLRIGQKDRIYYEFPVTVVSKVIKTASELLNLKNYGSYTDHGVYDQSLGFNDTPYSKYTLDGYFVLGNNIDLSSYTTSIAQYDAVFKADTLKVNGVALPKESQPDNFGFVGVFDGCGYTVNGGTYGWCGLFGYVGSRGVIKNVAFTNCTLNPVQTYYTASVIAGLFCGSLENVLIDVVTVKNSLTWGYSQGVAWHLAGAKLKNCVVYYPQNTGANYARYAYATVAYHYDPAYLGLEDTVAENCYSISGGQSAPHGDGATSVMYLSQKFTVKKYAFGTACENIEWMDLDTSENGYWVLTGDKAKFKSSNF